MRIAILYVCTGRYSIFWKDFFTSCERYFFPEHEKHYFVFTDDQSIWEGNERVHRIEQAPWGWPDITLKRYHMFAGIQDQLRAFDCIFFFNANVRFCREINDACLPDAKHPLVFQQHPGFHNKPAWAWEKPSRPWPCCKDYGLPAKRCPACSSAPHRWSTTGPEKRKNSPPNCRSCAPCPGRWATYM